MFNSAILFMVTLPLATGFPHMASVVSFGLESANLPMAHFRREHTTSSGLTKKHFNWKAPGDGDVRAPCPVMNTLANHDFVPHNGRNITMPVFVQACLDAFNISAAFCIDAFGTGVAASNPVPNSTFFDLDMLHNTHGVIEHDGSLSRRDAVFDLTNRFDEGTFNNLVSYFGNSTTIDIATMANARARHAFDMSLINPGFNITEAAVPVIMGENAMMMAIWGHPESPIANRAFYEYFFRNERIPVELGWRPSDVEIDSTVGSIVQDLIAQSPPDVPLTFTPSNGSTFSK